MLGWFFIPLAGQNRISTESIDLSNQSVSDSSNLHSMFALLAVNNEKNINNLHLKLNFKQFVEHTNQGVRISWVDVYLSGDYYFRDFNFDTLVMPDRGLVTLSWVSETDDKRMIQQYKVHFPAKNLIFKLYGYQGESLKIKLDFYLSAAKYTRFEKTAAVANHYYGFYSVLENINKNRRKGGEKTVCLNYIEVYRALQSIKKLQLVSVLNLNSYDPQKLLILMAKLKRYEIRERTLSKNMINNISDGGLIKGVVIGLPALSVKYLSLKSRFQPNIAASYELMAGLSNDFELADFYKKLCNSFDQSINDNNNLCQQVFDGFINHSKKYRKAEKYVSAMIMLRNANLWSNIVSGVNREPAFSNQLNEVLDGMMTSYLKVAAASYRSQNRAMAQKYINKADKLFKTANRDYPNLVSGIFPSFQSTLIELCNGESRRQHFRSVLNLLYKFSYLNYTSQQKSEIFRLRSAAYQQIYRQYIQSAQTAFNNGYIDEALQQMRSVFHYRQLKSVYVAGEKQSQQQLKKIAYGLILEYIQRGEILLDSHKSVNAMENFSIALELQNDFLDYRVKRLDDLISQTAIPVILDKIENAELEVWANKISEAQNDYHQIIALQHKYYLEHNREVNKRISALTQMLNNRPCMDAGYSLSGFLEVAQNRIAMNKWEEAAEAMDRAKKIIRTHRKCNLDTVRFTGLQYRYRFALNYARRYKKVTDNLYAYGYEKVWKSLAELDLYYVKHKLKLFGVKPSGQYQILESQKNNQNVERVVRYYLSNNNSRQAFKYLLLLKKLGLSVRKTKALQIEVGKQLADQVPSKQFSKITDGHNDWLMPLIKTYFNVLNQ